MKRLIITACLCACMLSFTGCSGGTGEQHETSSADPPSESAAAAPPESTEPSTNDTSSESSTPHTSSSEPGKNIPYDEEILLNREILEMLKKDILYVFIHLYIGEEALRAEYNEKYPEIAENDYYWSNFLYNRNEQKIKDFLSDYGIAYEDVFWGGYTASIYGDFDKSIISSMLDDSRVAKITYFPGGSPLSNLHDLA